MGKWLWGFIILAIISALITLLTPWGASKHSVEMGDSIRSALSADKFDFAKVEMDGNIAKLTGDAPSQVLADEAANIAAKTECKTCKKKGKIWHKVSNDFNVAKAAPIKQQPAVQVVSPYTFRVTKNEDGAVDISGVVRNAAERDRVIAEAEALYGDRLRAKKIRIGNGAPNDGWGDIISMHMPELDMLDSGVFTLNDTQALVRGKVGDAAIRDRINTVVTSLPGGYGGAANIVVPNAQAVNVGEVKDAGLCQSLFDQLKGSARINFASARAEIRGAQSFDLLNTLASAANQCKTFRVLVEGHTDSEGADDYNQQLSEQRAASVVAYLADNGVDISRLTAKGFGENQPVATNDTPEGRAANRRINFVVTQSE